MDFNRKIKKATILGYIIQTINFLLYAGLLIIAVITTNSDVASLFLGHNNAFNYILWAFTLASSSILILEYYLFRKSRKAVISFNQSLIDAEEEAGAIVLTEKEQPINAIDAINSLAISTALNHSLKNLNDKKVKLESEMEINQRLSENITEFYKQMKTLKNVELAFDFFEYDIKSSVFVFFSGMITALAKEIEQTEITADDLFVNYPFSISITEFYEHVIKCFSSDKDLDFECGVESKEHEKYWLRFWGRLSKDKTRITGAVTDITSETKSKIIERERTIRDNITGFYNRNALPEVAEEALEQCRENEKIAFVYIGLAEHQDFQERFGKMAANSYIKECAEIFKKHIESHTIPLRWLGPDFLFLITGVKDIQAFRENTLDLMERVENDVMNVEGIVVTISLAVGYAISGIHGNTPAELLEYASFAEHESMIGKAASPNEFNYERFEAAHKASLRRMHIKDIIEKNELRIVFQPIISLRTGNIFGFEALSRSTNPAYSNIEELINDAESSGNYVFLEKRMVYNALQAYTKRDKRFKDSHLFINTVPYTTLDESDYEDIKNRYFGDMHVVFEIIERNRMEPDEINLRKSIVKKTGAKFALDDFGTGYSNHIALLALEPDIIKIDRQLINNINGDLRKQYMLEDIMKYARYRGTRVLGEGVETKEELVTLCRMGIDYAQGYFIGYPNHELIEPTEEAKSVIKGINSNYKIKLEQVYKIVENTFSLVNKKFGYLLSIGMYLLTQMCKKLGFDTEKLTSMVTIGMLYNVGIIYPESEDNSLDQFSEMPEHSIFAYLMYKEFHSNTEDARVILYHHKQYKNEERINGINVPDEAYLLSFVSLVTDIILSCKEDGVVDVTDVYNIVMRKLNLSFVNPDYIRILEELCQDELLEKIIRNKYRTELMDCIGSLSLSKANIEIIFRIFIYSITFKSQHNYTHPKIMETVVNLLGSMTKQSWHVQNEIRMAALLYNVGMVTMSKDEYENYHTPQDLHEILAKAVNQITLVFEEAGLIDTVNILKASVGDNSLPNQHMLMSKDIIVGAKMLNIADIFASIIEREGCNRDKPCQEIINELKIICVEKGVYHSMIELMEEYIEDVEVKITSSLDNITKHYNNVNTVYKKLKNTAGEAN